MLQSDAVSTQTTRVQKLKEQAATGKVSVAKVQQEESVLAKMTVSNHLVSFTPCSCFLIMHSCQSANRHDLSPTHV